MVPDMEPDSDYPTADEGNEELSYVYLDECSPYYCEMSFRESIEL